MNEPTRYPDPFTPEARALAVRIMAGIWWEQQPEDDGDFEILLRRQCARFGIDFDAEIEDATIGDYEIAEIPAKATPAPSPARMTPERRTYLEYMCGPDGGWDETEAAQATESARELIAELAAVEARLEDKREMVRGVLRDLGRARQERDELRAQLPTPDKVRAAAIDCWRFGSNRNCTEDEIGKLTRIIAHNLGVDLAAGKEDDESAE